MLKKSDLAKQFELVVQQEITNYNNSLSQIFQKIQSIQDDIESIKEAHSSIRNSNHSRYQTLDTAISFIKEYCESNVKQIYTVIREQALKIHEQSVSNEEVKKCFDRISYKFDALGCVNNQLFCDYKKLINDCSEFNKETNSRIDEMGPKIKKAIDKAKKEIEDAPTEASQVKIELEKRIDSHKIDVEGVMKEINIFRKENVIVEKKLENIYTLIQRLEDQKQ